LFFFFNFRRQTTQDEWILNTWNEPE
jgi:hypothetical protein